MTDLGAFLDMGGYGAFVWSAFGVTVVVLLVLLLTSLRSLKSREAAAAQLGDRPARKATP
jgi:heme exporter protein D